MIRYTPEKLLYLKILETIQNETHRDQTQKIALVMYGSILGNLRSFI